MFRRPTSTKQDDFSEARHEVWGSFMDKLEGNLSAAGAPNVLSRRASSRAYSSVLLSPPGVVYNAQSEKRTDAAEASLCHRQMLMEWINKHRLGGLLGDMSELRSYHEKCVHILHSLVLKVITTVVKDKTDMQLELAVHPNLIVINNIMVHPSIEEGEAAYLIQNESNQDLKLDSLDSKYAALKALGVVSYQLFMRGSGLPSASGFTSAVIGSGDTRLSLCLNDHDSTREEQYEMDQVKRRREQDKNQGTVMNTMLNNRVPFPLCRLTVDLLGGESNDGVLFRGDNSFQSFTDLLADLQQMMENPEAFMHLSVKDQWALALGSKFHCRQGEMNTIMDAATRVAGTPCKNDALFEALALVVPHKQQFVMVTGPSGSGKSRLVSETIKCLEEQNWCHLCCKFDKIVYAHPLSIIAGAFNQHLELCLTKNSSHIEISKNLKQNMQSKDVSQLSKHVPCLLKYVDDLQPDDSEVDQEQLHQLFCQLLDIISDISKLVFFVDDLQWMDAASIGLLFALTKANASALDGYDSKRSNVLFVGCYRDNGLDESPRLVKMIDDLERCSSVEVTSIDVYGFVIEELNAIVSECLVLPRRRAKPLTEIILQKTDGIVIHVIEFVRRLVADRLLTQSLVRGWEWDCDVIDSYPISDSVAELFIIKLKTLPKDVLAGLLVCSIFGNCIQQCILDLVHDYDGEKSADLNSGLTAALDLGIVEEIGATPDYVFKFAHDIIAQTTIDMIPDDERSTLLQKLAASLIRNATANNSLDSVTFVAVDLINRVPNTNVIDEEERLLYAKMNNEAAKKALAVPDFSSAVKYSEAGLSFIDERHWQTHRVLLVELCATSVAALHSCTNGNQSLLKERMNAVFNHAISLEEEFRTRCLWIHLLAFTSLERAIVECHNLLARLGEPIDSSITDPTFVNSELARVKDAFSACGKNFAASRMSDANKIKAMKIMTSLTSFYHYQRSVVGGIVSARMVELTMRFGYCEESVTGLAFFSSYLVNILGNIDDGCSCARMSLTLSLKSGNVNNLPAVYACVYGLVLMWKEPMQASLEPLLKGCSLAFNYGNVFWALGNTHVFVMRSYLSGKKINLLLKEIEALAQKCAQHGQKVFIQGTLTPVYNVLRELSGLSPQALPPLELHLDNDQLISESQKANKTDQISVESKLLLTISQAVYLRDFGKAQKMAKLFEDAHEKGRPVFLKILISFYAGLTACHFGRETKDPRWHQKARNHCKRIEMALAHSVWNMENKYLLLMAECHYTKGDVSEAAKLYEESITSARNHRIEHEAALASELAGHFFVEQGDLTKAETMFEQAHALYEEWGANKKAQALLQRHEHTK